MPCDTLRTVGVKLDKSDAQTMLAALIADGHTDATLSGTVIRFNYGRETIDTATGQAQLAPGREINAIKRAYSTQVVKQTAKKYGWTLNQTALGKFQTIKR